MTNSIFIYEFTLIRFNQVHVVCKYYRSSHGTGNLGEKTKPAERWKGETTPRWWQLKYFWNFHHYLGKIPILTNIFQMGCNHQLDSLSLLNEKSRRRAAPDFAPLKCVGVPRFPTASRRENLYFPKKSKTAGKIRVGTMDFPSERKLHFGKIWKTCVYINI